MTVKEAKEIIEKMKKCNEFYEQGTKGRCYSFYVTCGNCPYCVDKDKYDEACNIAEKSLEVWEEVIEEITEEHDKISDVHFEEEWAYGKVLKIIEKHLKEIEEVDKKI